MNRRRLRLAGFLGLVVGGLLMFAPTASAGDAASLDDVGWWARTNQDPVLGAVSGPDTAPGQLLVEGAPDGASALAALKATLPPDTGTPVLTLKVASEFGAADAVLLACQAGSTWEGAHAGAWDKHPKPDCSQSVQGVVSDDGSEFVFQLGPLQFGNQIDVVLTPGLDETRPEGLNSSVFRIVFDRPTASSIQVSDAPKGFAPNLELPEIEFTPAPAASGSGGSTGGDFSSPSFTPIDTGSTFTPPADSGEVAMPSAPARAALPADEQGQTASAPILGAQQGLAAAVEDGADAARFFGFAIVLAAGGLLAWSSSQPVPERLVLSRFAATASTHTSVVPAVEDESMGGLGRFRRIRNTPAHRIGG